MTGAPFFLIIYSTFRSRPSKKMGIIQGRCKVVTWEEGDGSGRKDGGHLIHWNRFIKGLVTLIRLIKIPSNNIMVINKICQERGLRRWRGGSKRVSYKVYHSRLQGDQ